MSETGPNASVQSASRLLNLVPFLLSHQGISLALLAEEFDTSVEDMTSDLVTLWMCGLPGYTPYELIDLSFESGFVTISNAQTLAHPRRLERNEALALLLGLQTLVEEVTERYPDLATTIIALTAKVSALIDQSITQRVKVGTPAPSVARGAIESAMQQGKLLQLTYHSASRDSVNVRLVQPLELILRNGLEYLEAFCFTTSGYRVFRVDRILEAAIDSSRAEVKIGNGDRLGGEPVTFSIDIRGRYRDVLEEFGLPLQATDPDAVREVSSFSAEWALRETMAFGGDVVILPTSRLRALLRERAQRALDGYQNVISPR